MNTKCLDFRVRVKISGDFNQEDISRLKKEFKEHVRFWCSGSYSKKDLVGKKIEFEIKGIKELDWYGNNR